MNQQEGVVRDSIVEEQVEGYNLDQHQLMPMSNEEIDNDFHVDGKVSSSKDEQAKLLENRINPSEDVEEAGPAPPQSPVQRFLRAAGSPGRLIKSQVAPGSVKASIFSLVIICLGAGTLAIPYAFYSCGFFLGTFAILFGGVMSMYTGYLVAYCAEATGGTCYEEIAMACFGKKGQVFTSICMIACNIGFAVSYMVLFKTMMPHVLESILLPHGKTLPAWCANTKNGQIIWVLFFTFVIVFPISIPRTLTSLRFTSFFSVIMSMFIVLVIIFSCLVNRNTTPQKASLSDSFSAAWSKQPISATSIFNTLPIIIFAFMYQINIPALYTELKVKSLVQFEKVLLYGTSLACVCYVSAGMFGWVTFAATPGADYDKIFDAQNILLSPYDASGEKGHLPVVIFIAQFALLIVIAFATPFCVLPTKDSFEEVLGLKEKKLSKCQNFWATVGILVVSAGLSIPFESVGSVMTILGATTNSAVGFLLPIGYYLKCERKQPTFSNKKCFAYFIFVFVCVSSVIELTTFGIRMSKGTNN